MKTTEQFIEEAKQIHGDKYDYSKVIYNVCDEKICIVCPEHGEFWQTPYNHTRKKCGCPACSGSKKLTTDEFIVKSKKIHGNKYDYSKVEYVNNSTKVCIICPEHGEFWQLPKNHLLGKGCSRCNHGIKYSKSDFVERAKLIHGNKYDYSKVEYINSQTKVCIICPEHGEFWQTPADHLFGYGCSKCVRNNFNLSTEEFIEKAKQVHGDKYDYSKTVYDGWTTKVCITCSKHGDFYQMPSKHLNGQGCPKCKSSHLEIFTGKMLTEAGIKYKIQIDKNTFEWLGKQKIDIYIPSMNIGIECQGEQHFKEIAIWGGKDGLDKRIKLDKEKYEKCIKNGIKLLYVGEPSYADKYNLLTIEKLKKILTYDL